MTAIYLSYPPHLESHTLPLFSIRILWYMIAYPAWCSTPTSRIQLFPRHIMGVYVFSGYFVDEVWDIYTLSSSSLCPVITTRRYERVFYYSFACRPASELQYFQRMTAVYVWSTIVFIYCGLCRLTPGIIYYVRTRYLILHTGFIYIDIRTERTSVCVVSLAFCDQAHSLSVVRRCSGITLRGVCVIYVQCSVCDVWHAVYFFEQHTLLLT